MEEWRARLIKAVDDDGRSDRAISVAAKLGPNFVNELRNSDKEPGINKVAQLARALNLSLGYVLNGTEISAVAEDDLRLFLSLPPESRQAILLLARQIASSERDI